MQNAGSSVAVLPGRLAGIQCAPLPLFDCSDLACVRRAFQSAVALPLLQPWLPEAEAGFSPGEVRLGWRENSLMLYAELTDLDIFNPAKELNQRLWELGDVFEMFFKSDQTASHVEFQVSPENQRLQLSHPHECRADWARHREDFSRCLLWHDVFQSRTWLKPGANRWHVYAAIPARTVCGSDQPIEHSRWRVSFGRYDYTREVEGPVISSTSLHAAPDFHRQHEWDLMTFTNSLVILER